MKLPNKRFLAATAAGCAVAGVAFGIGAPAMAAPDSSVHAAASTHRPTVSYGSVGGNVWIVQDKVGATVDDFFGRGTEAAVKRFQVKHHLVADGIVGPHTWAALNRIPLSLTRLGVTKTAVKGAKYWGASVDMSQTTGMFYYLRRSAHGNIYVSRASMVSFAGWVDGKNHHTPNGVYHVLAKGNAGTVSNLYKDNGKPAPMPYYVRLTWGGLGFHFGYRVPSHDCAHVLSMSVVKFVNETIPRGSTAVIHG